jgi:hypothetical protein
VAVVTVSQPAKVSEPTTAKANVARGLRSFGALRSQSVP